MTDAVDGNKQARQEPISSAIEAVHDELVGLSLDIHAHPEINYQEFYSSGRLVELLTHHGFEVERGVGGVETAFRAAAHGGAGAGPTVAILAEYDALPEIGHACGHNLIATAAIGAVLGVKAVLEQIPGTVVIMGTPAEEGGGGKIRLLEAGVFEDIDVVISSHPAANHMFMATDIPTDESWGLALVGYRYIYHGQAAHAAIAPQQGVNALNSVIQLYTGIDALRQHLQDDVRIHGIITDGGKAANIVPDFAAANFMLRARDRDYLHKVVEKVQSVAEAAAQMTGARLEIVPFFPFYENFIPNQPLVRTMRVHAEAVGFNVEEPHPMRRGFGASSDFGNVSQVLPSCGLSFAVSEEPVAFHTSAMTEVAKSDLAQERTLAAAKVLAMTACDVLTDTDLLTAAQEDHSSRIQLDQQGEN